jgi:hypothetical protein
MPVKKYLLDPNDPPKLTLADINARKYQPDNFVQEEVAAIILDVHRVTLRVWRRQDPPRGPAFSKSDGGDIRYRYGDLLAWFERNKIDPSNMSPDALLLYQRSRSGRSRVQFETGEVPSGDDVFAQADE